MLMYEIFRSFGLRVIFRPSTEDQDYKFREDREELEEWEREHHRGPPIALGLSRKFQMWKHETEDGHEWNEWTGKKRETELGREFGQERQAAVKRVLQHSGYVDGSAVHWLNRPGHEEPQVSWLYVSFSRCRFFFFFARLTQSNQYGNQAEGCMTYSSLAIVAVIPEGGVENAADVGPNESEESQGIWEQTKVVAEHWDDYKKKQVVLVEGPGEWLPRETSTVDAE